MFKLESYITPIILNHVAKYVKNIRPTDAQVSLWEGEVAFQNLDLRLDVLEEELNLPFEFLSGHIHELTIHVPWTKITSEPINITINTIEFVLKLKDQMRGTIPVSELMLNKISNTSLAENQQQQQQQQQGTGYMPGLVQKIINNIAITCHNIILKYIEEDIVVSMNVQLLSVNSANDEWQPSFIDISPTKFLLRKLIQISDLTICLDKRNSEGQIEVCQEPILYRCSLELRIIHSTIKSTMIRIGILTKSMEINISSLQFPMAMRLIALMMALKSGVLKRESDMSLSDSVHSKETINKNQQIINNNNNESYLSWMWNLLPDFSIDDDNDEEKLDNDEIIGRYLNIGIYISNLQIILKSSEFINDSIVGTTKKIKYNSIVKITLGGIFSETLIVNAINWFDTKAGISKITIEPLGNYINDDNTMNLFLTSNTEPNQSYLNESLFDKIQLPTEINFITNPIKYLEKYTEDYLIYRGSCIVFDMVQYKELTNKNQHHDDSILNVMLNNNQLDKTITRIYLSSIRFKYNKTFIKTVDTIKELISTYDYPPYSSESTSSNSNDNKSKISEDNDILLDDRPVKIYQLILQKMNIEIYPEAYLMKKHRVKPSILIKIKSKLPHFVITIDHAHSKAIIPTDTETLINYVLQSSKKSKELLKNCYNNFKIEFKNIIISLHDVGCSYPILIIPKGIINSSKILQESQWLDEDIHLLHLQLNIDTLQIKFNRPQLLLTIMLIDIFLKNNYESAINIATATARIDIHNSELKYLETTITDILFNFQQYKNIIRLNGFMKSIQCYLHSNLENNIGNLIFHTAEHLLNIKRKKFLLWTIQLPKCFDNIKHSPSVSMEMESFYFIISSEFIKYLQYENIVILLPKDSTIKESNNMSNMKKPSTLTSERSNRKISNPQETIHLSSDKDDHVSFDMDSFDEPIEKPFSNKDLFNTIKLMLIHIKINHGIMCILDKSMKIQSISQILKLYNVDHTKIILPKIIFKSSVTNKYLISNTFEPINVEHHLNQTFPWTCSLTDFHILNESKLDGDFKILQSVVINITFDLTNKKETIGMNKLFLQNESTERIKTDLKSKLVDVKYKGGKFQNKPQDEELDRIKAFNEHDLIATTLPEPNMSAEDVIEINNDGFNSRRTISIAGKDYSCKPIGGGKLKCKLDNNNIDTTINLHIDTSPIIIEISPQQAQCTILRLSYLFQTITLFKYRTEFLQNHLKIFTSAEEDPIIKEFLEFDSNSELSHETVNKNLTEDFISIWLQWTITKIIININSSALINSKMTIELEDLIISLARQIDHTKISFKIGTFFVRYYQKNIKNNEWILNESLKMTMLTENSQSVFFNMIVTIVETSSVFKKIGGARTKSGDLNTMITEIILSLQAIEIIFDMDRFAEFLPVFFHIATCVEQQTDHSKELIKEIKPIMASDLPLAYIDCKGFTIYLPIKTKIDWCSAVIFKVEEIQVSSIVQNPYNRVPVRSDVYNKAAQLGILNLPGSIVEDRQYDFTISNISAATGSWHEILNYMKEHKNHSHNTNPAFEWNNKTINTPLLEIQEIFNNFIITITYAPCIIYNNILICGQAVEFNCVADLIATITTDQLSIFSCMIKHWNEILTNLVANNKTNSLLSKSRESVSSQRTQRSFSIEKHFDNYEQLIEINEFYNPNKDDLTGNSSNITESIVDDSGISVYEKIRRRAVFLQKGQDERNSKSGQRQIPYDLSFLAGVFFFKLYQSNRKLIQPKIELETPEARSLIPLITITLNQPCMLISQRIFEYSIQISLFNCYIHLPNLDNILQNKEFPVKFFDTRRGKLNLSGIPPSFLAIRVHYTKSKKSQIDCIIAKPCQFYISHKTIEHFVDIWIAINNSIIPNLESNTIEIIRDSKIQMIRNLIFNADRFYLKLSQLNIKLREEDYELNNVLDDFRIGLNFVKRPEKMNLLCSFVSFYMQSKSKIILHPIALRTSLDLQQEEWYNIPLISVKINFNVIHADISIQTIINFINFHRAFRTTIELINQKLDELNENIKQHKLYKEFDKTNLKNMTLPEISSKRSSKSHEEFYRDDLRAGAFQFIETDDDSTLPLPYQIHIISKNYGVICWRYPKPRKICRLHIYPIPMPISNPADIKCEMQYYSQPHNSFLHYCEFMLSETDDNEINLPERTISSTIWRVIILQSLVSVDGECFDTSEEDEELKSIEKIENILDNIQKDKTPTQLHPKVLVGCMRIDTLFNPELIQKIQILIDFDEIIINLQTVQIKNAHMPPPLQKFQIANQTSANESFLTLKFDNIKIHSNILTDKNYTFDINLTFYALCLDYGFYNQEYLLEETNLKSYIEFIDNNIESNINIDKININFGPDIMHTLMVSKRYWEEQIDINKITYPILSRFILANRINYDLIFGQANTKERLHLLRRQCTMYTFFSDMHEQNIVFYINDKKSKAIPIFNQDSIKYLECGNNILIIKTKKQSSTQTIVYIKGQIELISMIDEEFQLEFRKKCEKKCITIQNQEYNLELNAKTSFCLNIFHNSDISFRLKLKNIFNTTNKGWTGDIPIRPNKNLPWLVKVPSSINEDFISIWIRIHFEDIPDIIINNEKPQRVLITIWPIFILRSMFPKSMTMSENTTDILTKLKGKGDEYQFKVGATHETNHEIAFLENFEPTNDNDNQKIILSLKSLNWNEFFAYDTKLWTIDNILTELGKITKMLWPVNDEIELQLNRKINIHDNNIPPIYKYYPNLNTSCSLLLEISPWCMIINSLSNQIHIYNIENEDENLAIGPNHISTIFLINKGFKIKIEYGTNWFISLPIFFNKNECGNLSEAERLIINDNEKLELTLQNITNLVIKIILQCIVENDRKILIVKPIFVIINNTDEDFEIIPFCIENEELIIREDIQSVRVDNIFFLPKRINETNCKGLSLEYFNYIQKVQHKTQLLMYFVCFKPLNNFDITVPIPIDTIYNRKCFSLQKGNKSIPLCASLLNKNGQNYLNIFIDTCPAILVENETNLNFFIGQVCSNNLPNTNKDSPVILTPECNGRNFEWYQILRENCQLYYTPPEMYLNYPDIKSVTSNISLAVINDENNSLFTNNTIQWSKPIKADSSCEKFFFIPLYGDVKIIVCDKHKCIRISIFYIAEHLEFSVKDLRSRLKFVHKSDDTEISANSVPAVNSDIKQPSKRRLPDLCIHLKEKSSQNRQIKLAIFVKGITFSLFKELKKKSFLKTEICSLYMDDIKFSFNNEQHILKLIISNLQIDNQLYSNGKYDFPVVLCAEELYEHKKYIPSIYELNNDFARNFQKSSIIKIKINFYDDNSMDILSINCEINPIHAYIEDTYLNALLDYLTDLDPNHIVFAPKQHYEREILEDGQILIPKDIEYKAKCLAETIKIKSIRIAPMNVMLSVHTCVHLYIALDHSPLEFSAYEQQNIITQPMQFGYTIGWHYLSGAFFGAGWVVGSLEILGTPSGLARSFSIGLRDFVSMPFHGLLTGPWGFILGITNGSASLIRNITAGTVNSVSKLAASVARNIDRITFDDEHFQRTEALRRQRPQGFTEGFSQGLTGLGISILGAVGGLSRHPLQATSSVGIITGLGKGIVGAFTKPISGAAEFVALTGQGVLHTVGFNAMPIQRETTIIRNTALHPADGKVWKLLPEVLLKDDQILLYNEATLIIDDVGHHHLKPVVICMTSTILAILELDKDELTYILPIEKVEANIDKNDDTLIHIKSQKTADEDILSEDLTTNYKNQRIMNFLQSSETAQLNLEKRISWESLEDMINADKIDKKLHWSFYILAPLGKHLIKYIKIIQSKRSDE